MKVNLIDYTGSQSSDPLYAARLLIYTKNTRLTQGEETRQLVAEISKDDVRLGYRLITLADEKRKKQTIDSNDLTVLAHISELVRSLGSTAR